MHLRYKASLFSITDEDEFRNLVVWLEDQKIRWYKIEDRGELRDMKSSEWLKTFAKVVHGYNPKIYSSGTAETFLKW